jgi:hypothetical protein
MAPAARAAPAQESAARFIFCPHEAARAGLWSAGGPRCRARNGAARKLALAGHSRCAAARARHCCPAAGRLERSSRRLRTPARLPASGRDAPPGAFAAAGTSSDGALAASDDDACVVETLPPPPPPLERRAAVGRFLHGRVALSTAGRNSVRPDLVSLHAVKGTIKLVVGRQARQEAPIARRVAVLEQRMGGREIGCCVKLSELEQRACTG